MLKVLVHYKLRPKTDEVKQIRGRMLLQLGKKNYLANLNTFI